MKKYFDQLRPLERRFALGVLVVVFIVLNWLFIWPHFADWGNLSRRKADAHRKLTLYLAATNQIPALKKQVQTFESEGEFVALEDQSINFTRAIATQSAQSSVQILNTSPQQTHTNDAFFVEQVQNINVLATEPQLVDFLYKLGSGASMIRVRDLELQPDTPHQRLSARIQLVANYQKNPAASNAVKKPATAKAK